MSLLEERMEKISCNICDWDGYSDCLQEKDYLDCWGDVVQVYVCPECGFDPNIEVGGEE